MPYFLVDVKSLFVPALCALVISIVELIQTICQLFAEISNLINCHMAFFILTAFANFLK